MRVLGLLSLLTTVTGVFAGYDADSKSNVAVYWGQNSLRGKTSQDRLITYCQNTDVNVILLAFLLQFNGPGGFPVLNFANQGMAEKGDPIKCTLFPGTSLFHCPELTEDIQACQRQHGKTILLSLGGDAYTEGGFTSGPAAANATAEKIWATFGPPRKDWEKDTSILRPFGYASIDGFDFDFEAPVQNTALFARRLRELMDEFTRTGGWSGGQKGRTFYLSAAPQCPVPEVYMKDIMENAHLDFVMVQFYNNYCGVKSFKASVPDSQQQYSYVAWDDWARNTSKNKKVKILMGVPASTTSAQPDSYKSATDLGAVIEYSKKNDTFGGVMIWDASQAWNNPGFISGIKGKLR